MTLNNFSLRFFGVAGVIAFGLSLNMANAFAQNSPEELTGVEPTTTNAPEPPAGAVKEPEKDDGKLKPGVVASFGSFPKNTAVGVSEPVADISSAATSPILASVSRKGGEECEAVLRNQDKDHSYSVHFEVKGISPNGSTAVRRTFSATISPSSSTSRTLACRKDLNMQVVLTGGKRLK
jgi:hypothetical protein